LIWGYVKIEVGARKGKYWLARKVANIMKELTSAGYVNKRSIAPFVFYGSCDTQLFETWVEQCLIKELVSGQIVIMDNASFHKSKKTDSYPDLYQALSGFFSVP
jgi:hypothetical protein